MRKMALVLALVGLFAASASANLIADGDFEGAGAGPWTTGTAVWGANQTFDFDAAGPTGQALRLYFPGASGQGSFAAIQTFSVPAGVSLIDISLDWRTVGGGSNGWYEVLLQPAGSNYDAPGAGELLAKREYGFGNPFPGPSGSWVNLSLTNIAVTPGGNYQIALKMGGSPGLTNEAWFDNVVVTPEPATLGLLALAGLPMLRRRHA